MLRYIQLAIISLAFSLLCIFALGSCAPGFTPPLGGRDHAVSVVGCLEPHASWIEQEVNYFGWHVAKDGEVTILCGESEGQGEFFLDTDRIVIDVTQVHSSFDTRAVAGHELVHWLIYRGPHPERVHYHICMFAWNDPAPPNCFPDVAADNVLMSPHVLDPQQDWFSEVYVGGFAEYRITEADLALINWGLAP